MFISGIFNVQIVFPESPGIQFNEYIGFGNFHSHAFRTKGVAGSAKTLLSPAVTSLYSAVFHSVSTQLSISIVSRLDD